MRGVDGDDTPALARALTRLVVLPFRVLRPDPETDFLAFSLPDAIATSLSGIGSLIVRSSATAARFAGEAPDLKALAAEADVDRVVMGTLLRSGDQLRAVGAARRGAGRHAADLAHRPVVARRSVPAAGRHRPARGRGAVAAAGRRRAVAHTRRAARRPRLRALPARQRAGAHLRRARRRRAICIERCLELDPAFAPAWAHLGRCHRVIGKFIDADARQRGARRGGVPPRARAQPAPVGRAQVLRQPRGRHRPGARALVRLLGEAGRHGNDPELFAGLVHACRYCGLFEQSIAAHAEARRLDPNAFTSFEQTLLMSGDIDRLLAIDRPRHYAGGDEGIRVIALGLAGRRDEAKAVLAEMRRVGPAVPAFQAWTEYLMAWLDRRPTDMYLEPRSAQHPEDSGRSRGDLPGRVAALRRRRARAGHRPPAARCRQGLLRGADAGKRSRVRRDAGQRGVPATARRCRHGTRAGAGRVSRGRRRTIARRVAEPSRSNRCPMS